MRWKRLGFGSSDCDYGMLSWQCARSKRWRLDGTESLVGERQFGTVSFDGNLSYVMSKAETDTKTPTRQTAVIRR